MTAINHLVTADSFLPHAGGSRVYYAALYKSLLEQFPDRITLLTKKVDGWAEFDRAESTDRFRIRRRFRPLPSWRYSQLPKMALPFFPAAAHAATGKFDCLHCGDLFPQALIGVTLRKLLRLPLLVFCHGDEISQTDRRRLQPRVRDYVYRNADAVVAANQFAKDRLLQIGIPEERIHKITPGVNSELFRPGPKAEHLIRQFGLQGSKVIMTAARLVPRKGHKVVLEALPQVLSRVPNLKYLIVGEGPELANLQNLTRQLQLHDVVVFVGNVPHDQIPNFYNLCDVMIMVNRLEAGGDVESFGMVFTEANAMGKAVIGGRSGGTSESVVEAKTGFLVEPDSPEDVARRLLCLLQNDELRDRIGAAGRARALAEFDWGTRGRALREVARQIAWKDLPNRAPMHTADHPFS